MEIIKPGTQFDFLGKRNIALTFSGILILTIFALIPSRMNLGVDFAGGTEIEVKFTETVEAEDVRKKIEAAGFADANVQQYGAKEENSFLVRVGRISILSVEQIQTLRTTLTEKLSAYGVQAIDFDEHVGDRIDVRTEKAVPLEELRSVVTAAGVKLAQTGESVRDLTRGGQLSYQLVTEGLSDTVSTALRASFGQDKVDVRRVEYVGPQVGAQLRNRGIMAVLLAMGAILIYVAFRFQPKYAPGGVIALFHDVSIVLGYYVVSGREFNLTSIAVLLTIVGYSINDTIVIFDRVREIEARRTGKSLSDILNLALNECLSRTLLTSLVTLLSLVGLLFYGVGQIFDFAAAMLVGLVSGTYSTIYVAAPFAIWIDDWMKKRDAASVATGKKPAGKAA